MFAFIFESIGTQELFLIGIVALIFLGPRRLPEIAKKLGKIMSDLRSTTSEFKETWEREVNFEEEVKALQINDLDEESRPHSSRPDEITSELVNGPEVKEIDAARFEGIRSDEAEVESEQLVDDTGGGSDADEEEAEDGSEILAKQNWL